MGTRHRCVVDATSPVVVTSAVAHRDDSITFTETDEKTMGCAVFRFDRERDAQTGVRVDFLVRDSFLRRMLIGLLLKKKLRTMLQVSLENLARYCKERYQRASSAA